MERDATKNQQFLVYVDETPYMTTWKVKEDMGELSGSLAGDFIGAKDWKHQYPVEAVADIGLEEWATQTAATEHAAAAGRRPHPPIPPRRLLSFPHP